MVFFMMFNVFSVCLFVRWPDKKYPGEPDYFTKKESWRPDGVFVTLARQQVQPLWWLVKSTGRRQQIGTACVVFCIVKRCIY
jgi:hypothetical protein